MTSSGIDEGGTAERGSVEMVATWIVVGIVVAAAVAGAVWLYMRRHSAERPGKDDLAGLIADALADEWAGRAGADSESVRRAVRRGEPAEVRRRLAVLVADVEASFQSTGPAGPVRVSVHCKYAVDGSATTVTMEIPWERVPQEVRAQFIRTGDEHISRLWSID